ncbi:MAG: carboxypeptidase regulatory-like domain-containing protein [Bacteroidetes bacterium]|nr:carboxypeptidase regulatory-like domain-containing protein [Bacteroidota bacterium]
MKHLSSIILGVFFILEFSYIAQPQTLSSSAGNSTLSPDPTVYFSPDTVVNYQFPGSVEFVPFTLGNSGQSDLNFQFPDFADQPGKIASSYCAATATNCDEYIGRVQFGAIDNVSNCGHYNDFTAVSTGLTLNEMVPVTITNGGNAYTTDMVYVWIDYNQNGSFEGSELTTLSSTTGGATFTGNIIVPLTAVPGPTTMRIRMSYATAADPCGTQSYGEVEDYTVILIQSSFVTAVVPISGTISPGTSQEILADFSSVGPVYSLPGVYYYYLSLTTNDPVHPTMFVPCKMVVQCQPMITGTVTDSLSGAPVNGALVMAGSSYTYTLGDGTYTLLTGSGIFNLVVSAVGYTSVTVPVMVPACETVQLDASLIPAAYAPACASSVVDPGDFSSTTVWCAPQGPVQLYYDDGVAENCVCWQLAGNENAVRFTPQFYPAVVTEAMIYACDGSYPVGGSFIGQQFLIEVRAADGPGDMPGTLLDSIMLVALNSGWIRVTGLNSTISSGDFYLVMSETPNSSNSVPIGIDTTLPQAYRSYYRNSVTGEDWGLSPYQDMMIRATITTPQGDKLSLLNPSTIKSPYDSKPNDKTILLGKGEGKGKALSPSDQDQINTASQGIDHYEVWRITGFDPASGPQSGNMLLLDSAVYENMYTETGQVWAGVPQGWVAYGIRTVYDLGNKSEFTYSNPVPHKLFSNVMVYVNLACGMVPAVGAHVVFTGTDYPTITYSSTVSAFGFANFANIIQGNYQMQVTFPGFEEYGASELISGDTTFHVVLQDHTYKPQNLQVDDMTLVASWDPPQSILLNEDFEGSTFPPAGWHNSFAGAVGWYHTNSGHFGYYQVPQHTWYAMTFDGDAGTNNNGCCDRLITPELNLTNTTGYALDFDGFYLGNYGLIATVEISLDSCQTWIPIESIAASADWQHHSIDLSQWSGPGGANRIWIAFHSDDAGQWSTGWCVDNIMVYSDAVANQGYAVFLDGTLVGQTQQTNWTFNPATVNYGQTYVVGVAGVYCSGFSDQDTALLTSNFLYPSRNLQVTSPSGQFALILTWDAPLSGDYSVIGSIPRSQFQNSSVEYSPYITQRSQDDQPNAMWDILLLFPTTSAGQAAVSSDGLFIYTADWNSASFHKYELSGNWISDFTIAGAGQIRDFDYANGVFYATNNTSDILKLDLLNQSLLGTINTTLPYLRHIAFDHALDGGNGGFWVGGFSDENQVTMNGSLIQSLNSFSLTSCSGSAMDTITPGGPYIWYFDQGGNGADIYQFDVYANQFTGFVQDATTLPGYQSGLSGGLDFQSVIVSGRPVLIGSIQQSPNLIFLYEMENSNPTSCDCMIGYNIYRDGFLLATVPPVPTSYWDVNLDPGNYCYEVSAIYDLTNFGFPGQVGESVKDGPECASMYYGHILPFLEDWTSGTFTLNEWAVGNNWGIDAQVGKEAPSVKFSGDPLMSNYNSSLESYWLLNLQGDTTIMYKAWIDFDLKLDEQLATSNEHLTIELWNGSDWDSIADYSNCNSMDWTLQHLDITDQLTTGSFKFRFRAQGLNSSDIQGWYIDNIHVYYEYILPPPQNLIVQATGNPTNDMHLSWQLPAGAGSNVTYQLDDNSDENGWSINPGYEGWLGNEFQVTDHGLLKDASLFWQANSGSQAESLSMDIFDSNRTLIGSSATFVPVDNTWQTISLPDIPFTGTFYAMVHWNMLAGPTNALGSDENGSNSSENPGWYYDGSTWSHLSDFGYNPNVFLLRVKAHLESGDHKELKPANQKPVFSPELSPGRKALVQSHKQISPTVFKEMYVPGKMIDLNGLSGYNIYKQYYLDPLPGQYDTLSPWEYVGSTTDNEFMDMDLFNNCYTYRVTAVYTYGESVPSNEYMQCISSGVTTLTARSIRIYPNPASTNIYIDITPDAKALAIYNSMGALVNRLNIKFGSPSILDVSDFEAGVYAIRFRMKDGSFETRRFEVIH